MKAFYLALAAACISQPAASIEPNPTAMVAAHNKWRAQVGVAPLRHSPDLAKSAQAWADHLKTTNHCAMRHSSGGKVGENLYWASAWSDGRMQDISDQHVVDTWGAEIKDYSYANNNCVKGKMCGHYTQVVWKSTKAVGCGVAVCADSKQQVWVCHYDPPGNWVGQKPY